MLFYHSRLIRRFLKMYLKCLSVENLKYLFFFCLSLPERATEAIFTFSGDELCLMLIFAALNKYGARKPETSFSSLRRILSLPTTVFLFIF